MEIAIAGFNEKAIAEIAVRSSRPPH